MLFFLQPPSYENRFDELTKSTTVIGRNQQLLFNHSIKLEKYVQALGKNQNERLNRVQSGITDIKVKNQLFNCLVYICKG